MITLPIKEEDFMAQFLSPSTRLELQRFLNWEEWLVEVTEETYAETSAISVGSTTNPASAAPPL
jgi:hypothetical protein